MSIHLVCNIVPLLLLLLLLLFLFVFFFPSFSFSSSSPFFFFFFFFLIFLLLYFFFFPCSCSCSSSSSLALQAFKFDFTFPYINYPFCSVQSSCSPTFFNPYSSSAIRHHSPTFVLSHSSFLPLSDLLSNNFFPSLTFRSPFPQ